ncbi:hypothetical protein [Nostoc sp.]|uniref:hypothetical protein n=1 Tax=Nostoc sp. TaxID=1180 RepID=UPI002FF8CE6C
MLYPNVGRSQVALTLRKCYSFDCPPETNRTYATVTSDGAAQAHKHGNIRMF